MVFQKDQGKEGQGVVPERASQSRCHAIPSSTGAISERNRPRTPSELRDYHHRLEEPPDVRKDIRPNPVLLFLGFFGFAKENPQNNQGFFYLPDPLKPWEDQRKHQINQGKIPCLRLTKEIPKTKEKKDREVSTLSLS